MTQKARKKERKKERKRRKEGKRDAGIDSLKIMTHFRSTKYNENFSRVAKSINIKDQKWQKCNFVKGQLHKKASKE